MQGKSLLDSLKPMLDDGDPPRKLVIVDLGKWPKEEMSELDYINGGKELLERTSDENEFTHGSTALLAVAYRAYYQRVGKKWRKHIRPVPACNPVTKKMLVSDIAKLIKQKKGKADNAVNADREATATRTAD